MSNKSIPKSIQTEMRTVDSMIRIFCADHHPGAAECLECGDLRNYAWLRLEYCRFGVGKPTCVKCPVHCYKADMREKICDVMRHSGPKMMLRHPWLALIHLWKEFGLFRKLELIS